GQTLRIVQAVDSDDELAAHQTHDHPLHRLLGKCRLGLLDDAIHINTDGIGAERDTASAHLDAAIRLEAHDRGLQTAQERADIVLGLKAHEVVLTQIPHQSCVPRKQAQYLYVREGDVQEVADRAVELELAQITTERNQ